MRGELFPEISDELQEYIETHEVEENELLAEDYHTLKKNYSIVLEYVKELEEKLRKDKEKIRSLNNKILYMEKQKEEDDCFYGNSDDIKSLKSSIAGLKSASVRQQKKIEKLEEIIVDKEKELIELRGFRDTFMKVLNEKGDNL